MTGAKLEVAVFASGGGTNFQALLDHRPAGCPWRVSLLVCNREAGAIERARAAGVAHAVVRTRDRASGDVARDTLDVLERHHIDLVCLAGYLRLLPSEVVARYRGRILNIHPALLPDFGGHGMYGMKVHEAVLAAGVRTTGATVHVVDDEYDRGQILAQARVPVHAGDAPEDVAARVLRAEHALYPRVVDHVCGALASGRPVEPMGVVDIEGSTVTSEERR